MHITTTKIRDHMTIGYVALEHRRLGSIIIDTVFSKVSGIPGPFGSRDRLLSKRSGLIFLQSVIFGEVRKIWTVMRYSGGRSCMYTVSLASVRES